MKRLRLGRAAEADEADLGLDRRSAAGTSSTNATTPATMTGSARNCCSPRSNPVRPKGIVERHGRVRPGTDLPDQAKLPSVRALRARSDEKGTPLVFAGQVRDLGTAASSAHSFRTTQRAGGSDNRAQIQPFAACRSRFAAVGDAPACRECGTVSGCSRGFLPIM